MNFEFKKIINFNKEKIENFYVNENVYKYLKGK